MDNYLKKFDELEKKCIYIFKLGMGGLGDYIKFYVYCLDLCIKSDIKLYLYVEHSLKKYINLKNSNMILENINNINTRDIYNIDDILINSNYDDNTYLKIYPSSMYSKNIYETINKYNLSDIFVFSDEIIINARKYLDYENIEEYISIHLRLGDKYLETDKHYVFCVDDEREYNETNIFNFLERNKDKNILFLCDNYNYKTKLKEKYNFLHITTNKIGHISFTNTTEQDCMNCVIEFYLLTKSKEICKASNSGFPICASYFYNIPIYDI